MIASVAGLRPQPNGSVRAGARNFSFCTEDDLRRNSLLQDTDRLKTKTFKTFWAGSEPVKVSKDDVAISTGTLYRYSVIEKRQYKYHSRSKNPRGEPSRKRQRKEAVCVLSDDKLKSMRCSKKLFCF